IGVCGNVSKHREIDAALRHHPGAKLVSKALRQRDLATILNHSICKPCSPANALHQPAKSVGKSGAGVMASAEDPPREIAYACSNDLTPAGETNPKTEASESLLFLAAAKSFASRSDARFPLCAS